MTRYIDADKLLKKKWDADTRCGYVQVVDVGTIEEQPTADVVEVVHGEWIRKDDTCTVFECSSCKKISDLRWDYCPNCGAKMRKKVE